MSLTRLPLPEGYAADARRRAGTSYPVRTSSQTNMAESPITPRSEDFAAWYQDVVLSGDMAEPAEIVKGCIGHFGHFGDGLRNSEIRRSSHFRIS